MPDSTENPPASNVEPSEAETKLRPLAWQPFTPRGIAAFARHTTGRLLVVESLMALLAAVVVAWFVFTSWFPVIRQAIQQLPQRGDIVAGRLYWSQTSPTTLAASRFLTIVVDLGHTGHLGQTSDVQLEFGSDSIYLSALLGYLEFPYPEQGIAGFNNSDLNPWWGAWSQVVLTLLAVGVAAGLMALWAALALCYAGPARLMASLAQASLSWGEAWRLCSAALMPGAMLMIVGIILYALSLLDVVQLGFFCAFHLVVGWVYLIASVFLLPKEPRIAVVPAVNPFQPVTPEDSSAPAGEASKEPSQNPFAGGPDKSSTPNLPAANRPQSDQPAR